MGIITVWAAEKTEWLVCMKCQHSTWNEQVLHQGDLWLFLLGLQTEKPMRSMMSTICQTCHLPPQGLQGLDSWWLLFLGSSVGSLKPTQWEGWLQKTNWSVCNLEIQEIWVWVWLLSLSYLLWDLGQISSSLCLSLLTCKVEIMMPS
jgi:hypothetical protein